VGTASATFRPFWDAVGAVIPGSSRRVETRPKSEMGQPRHFDRRPTTSGLPLETDIVTTGLHVSKVRTAIISTSLRGRF